MKNNENQEGLTAPEDQERAEGSTNSWKFWLFAGLILLAIVAAGILVGTLSSKTATAAVAPAAPVATPAPEFKIVLNEHDYGTVQRPPSRTRLVDVRAERLLNGKVIYIGVVAAPNGRVGPWVGTEMFPGVEYFYETETGRQFRGVDILPVRIRNGEKSLLAGGTHYFAGPDRQPIDTILAFVPRSQ